MPAPDRAANRNVHIYDAQQRDTTLGGLFLPPPSPAPVTRRTFWQMISILVAADGTYSIHDENGALVPADNELLHEGNYYIAPDDPNSHLAMTQEPVVVRTISLQTGPRVRAFMESVRSRDGGCVVTGRRAYQGDFTGFQAAHIFPLPHERYWIDNNFQRWINIMPSAGGAINSIQNGLLFESTYHQLFDSYAFSINPDDGYRFVWFSYWEGLQTTTLPQHVLDDERRPSAELLRWHFRQAVLANMRGAGEPIFEHDFPPGSDMLETIRNGPRAAEMMEAALFSRVSLQMELGDFDTYREAMEERAEQHSSPGENSNTSARSSGH